MGILRSYFKKNTTLIKDNYTNNSRNPIIELSYGNSTYTRYIFQIDLENLQDKIINNNISASTIVRHTVKIKNVINESKDLIGGVFVESLRGSNSTILIYPLNQNFSEGTGFDYIYNPTAYIDEFLNKTPANWYYADTNISWNQNGTFSSSTPSNIINTQYLQDGSEDIELDVTDYINGILFSGNTHYGLGICYTSTTENFNSTNRYVITFFSKYTQTFYEPFLETEYNNVINEDRYNFKLDTDNNLYLVSNQDIDSVNKVEIYNQDYNLYEIINITGITMVKDKVWSVTVNVPSDVYPDLVNFTDRWYYFKNGKQYTFDQEFTLVSNDYLENKDIQISEYHFSFNGILYNEKIKRISDIRKIYLKGKRLYGNAITNDLAFDSLEYRLYNQQTGSIQIEIIPWTKVNKIQNNYYFELDPTWLIPQFYFIELRVISNGYVIKTNNVIKFNIID